MTKYNQIEKKGGGKLIKKIIGTGKGLEYLSVLIPKTYSDILWLEEGTEMLVYLEGDKIVSKRLGNTKVINTGSQIKKLIQMKYSLYMPLPKGFRDAIGVNKGDIVKIEVSGNRLIIGRAKDGR